MADIQFRLQQIYESIGESIDTDPDHFDAKTYRSDRGVFMMTDFGQGRTDAQLANKIESILHSTGCLRDHVKDWAKNRGRDVSNVDDAIKNSRNMAIMMDLWNTVKHVELTRNPWSGMKPQLTDICSPFQISAGPGQAIFHQWDGATGKHTTNVATSGKIIVDATVVDENGNNIGTFDTIANGALSDWEQLITQLS
jgi:hypothetical protein